MPSGAHICKWHFVGPVLLKAGHRMQFESTLVGIRLPEQQCGWSGCGWVAFCMGIRPQDYDDNLLLLPLLACCREKPKMGYIF